MIRVTENPILSSLPFYQLKKKKLTIEITKGAELGFEFRAV